MIFGIIFYISIPLIILLFDLVSRVVINWAFSKRMVPYINIGKHQISKEQIHKTLNFVFCVLFLTCVCAFRSVSVGNDTKAYFDFYNDTKTYSFNKALQGNANYETGYVLYNYVFAAMKIPYYLFAFITYLFIFIAVVWCCFVLSRYPTISVCIYVCFTFFVLNLSTLRQSLAFGFCLYSLLIFYLTKKHYILKFLSVIPIILAISIHISSVAFLLVHCLYFVKIKTKFGFLAFFVSIATFVAFFPAISSFFIQEITNPSKVYSFYPPTSANTNISGTLILTMVVAIGYVAFTVFKPNIDLSLERTKVNNDNKVVSFFGPLFNEKEADNQLAISMIIFQIIFIILDNTVFLLSRVATYGSLGFCILLPNWIYSASKNKPNNLFLIAIVLFGVLYFFYAVLRINYLNILPYGVF